MRNLKILYVFYRSSHHSSYSGYEQFLEYIKNRIVIYPKIILPYKLAKKITYAINKGVGFYDTNSFYKDIQIIIYVLTHWNTPNIVVHYLNGERDIMLATWLFFRKKNVKFIASFHKPPEELKNIITKTKFVKKLDGAIIVGTNLENYIKTNYGLKNIYYVPHGVNINFFKPNYKLRSKNSKTILFVGQHLRNFKMFNSTIKLFLNNNEGKYNVNVILRKEYSNKIIVHSRVKIFSNITDIELLTHYQSADVLYLPLLNSTACNSILEALACGLPIVTTKNGGNVEYLENTKNFLINDNETSQKHKQAIENILNSDKDFSVSRKSREKSHEYKWDIVANQISKTYKLISD
jgi:glycosyltransferase involved in cell wall biosynthesis